MTSLSSYTFAKFRYHTRFGRTQELNVGWSTTTIIVMLHTKNTQTNQMPFNRLLTYIFNQIKDMGYSKGLSQRNESHTKYNKNTISYKLQYQYSICYNTIPNELLGGLFYYNWQANCFVNDGNTIFTLKIDNNGRAKLQDFSWNIETRYIHSKMLGGFDWVLASVMLRIVSRLLLF